MMQSHVTSEEQPGEPHQRYDNEKILLRHFRDIRSSGNVNGALQWFCAPDSWQENVTPGVGREGQGGKWYVDKDCSNLTIMAPAKKDFWRKTYYEPILVKDDGPFLYHELDASQHYTVETTFHLTAARQFDQAGLCVRITPEHWIKTGIEVVDGVPRLSCVVTNIYSDWSTQPWSASPPTMESSVSAEKSDAVFVRAQIRIHCRGSSFVVEAKESSKEWEFLRIGHLNRDMRHTNDPLRNHSAVEKSWNGPSAAEGKLWVGVFACCPVDQQGSSVTFSNFSIAAGSKFDHNADDNH
ncbi:predicted protein [Phaeodactylum tricornutum CCAP 1055/1]|jgi:hypothetical protein|uniref:Uncharacterized protein n=2 Tax=Phaeodactylum tricornutum TaxID=2850 RepID=B5Y432_PHATC|nr:predicted protein [Phaeodactylum tricornutum CCAP 1055/1]ACI65406.1 predicted protein [Phaeodactylum tricornutum CCAP 1055/1]|eukprot:XP_002185936.1 predicted protein [Phaeodactylum tricornutum CCAP 1055/1]